MEAAGPGDGPAQTFGQIAEGLGIHRARGRGLSVAIEERAVRQLRCCQGVDQGVGRTDVEGPHQGRRIPGSGRRQQRGVGDAAQVQDDAAEIRMTAQQDVGSRQDGRPLPAQSQIGRAQIGDRRQPRGLGHLGAATQLQRTGRTEMGDGLAVGYREGRCGAVPFGHGHQGRAAEDAAHLAVQPGHVRGRSRLAGGQRKQFPPRARRPIRGQEGGPGRDAIIPVAPERSDRGVDPVDRRAAHQSDADEFLDGGARSPRFSPPDQDGSSSAARNRPPTASRRTAAAAGSNPRSEASTAVFTSQSEAVSRSCADS